MSGESDAELLRAVLANSQVIPEVLEITGPQDMYAPRDQTIFKTMLEIWSDNETLDPATLVARIDSNGQLEACGGMGHLAELSLGNPSSATFHAAKVRRDAELRRLAATGVGLQQRAESAGANPDDILSWADDELTGATNDVSNKVTSIRDSLADTLDWIENGEEDSTLPTGFDDLDELLNGGLRGGQMIIVAARPGSGKTVLGQDIARNAAINHGKTVLFFSLEMSMNELNVRMLAAESNSRVGDLLKHKMPDMSVLSPAVDRLEQAPIYIDDTPGTTMTDIKAKARMTKQKHGLDLIIIDYLQLLSSGGRVESRQQEVSEYSRSIKILAKELDVPIIAIAQLNRDVEKRGDDAAPSVSDLRESGSLEQDADAVVLINRPDAKDLDHARAGEADFILGKNRGGSIGTVTVAHMLHRSKFVNPPRFDSPPPAPVPSWSPTDSI